jgi:hypothetical protein
VDAGFTSAARTPYTGMISENPWRNESQESGRKNLSNSPDFASSFRVQEKDLEKVFDEDYLNYRKKARRWI